MREVLVRDGQRVAQGEPLLVLGDVSVEADGNRLDYRVMAERASIARLEAEQMAARALDFPADVSRGRQHRPASGRADRQGNGAVRRAPRCPHQPGVAAAYAAGKVQQEAVALRAQIVQAAESLKHQTAELETNRGLLKDGFISATRISQLEASVADYHVKLEENAPNWHARSRSRWTPTCASSRSKANTASRRATSSRSPRRAWSRSSRSSARPPMRPSGRSSWRRLPATSINLKFTTPGAVVSPREPIADIVPADPRLVVEAHIRTEDVSRVQKGQARRHPLHGVQVPHDASGARARCSTCRPTGWSTTRPTSPTTWR